MQNTYLENYRLHTPADSSSDSSSPSSSSSSFSSSSSSSSSSEGGFSIFFFLLVADFFGVGFALPFRFFPASYKLGTH